MPPKKSPQKKEKPSSASGEEFFQSGWPLSWSRSATMRNDKNSGMRNKLSGWSVNIRSRFSVYLRLSPNPPTPAQLEPTVLHLTMLRRQPPVLAPVERKVLP
ncbi:hypothetical protein FJT64_006000 [Amphibalanus amphitrite]|uniref:Uncharacterized protein n=1 Tax=Amphibalanus amphitrite TaxID=1232801 RepID=A0A6A4VPM6_AMPAM|nr:hypothetical protein FJT64_006000 [Amphibalanus amphitrite]